MRNVTNPVHRWYAMLLAGTVMLSQHAPQQANGPTNRWSDDRGDVPGWVMITMMTALVVIVLLGVFQEAVVTAVTNAFNSITG